ncbi:hypothetical protein [Lentibacillus sediminis]|uniref:hypothetical protein n=1 Tax=Lentibacillus sediminis TaxID=1940529 RepID=UPI00117A52E1|nr:hypothetical protein [Lentibacillus sediminis]
MTRTDTITAHSMDVSPLYQSAVIFSLILHHDKALKLKNQPPLKEEKTGCWLAIVLTAATLSRWFSKIVVLYNLNKMQRKLVWAMIAAAEIPFAFRGRW